MGAPEMMGFGHIDFTITDPERSRRWWEEVMGFRLTATFERPGFKGWSMWRRDVPPVGLIAHDDRTSDVFDERRVGLDHFAFRVRDRAALERWVEHLDAVGVAHSGIKEENGGPLVVFRDPDNIQIEVWAFDPALIERGEDQVERDR